jgi:uncharacterized membrane protein YfcA
VSAPEAVAIFAAGIGAGVINVVVGSGTLLTFPVLLGFGYPPVVANVSNTIGLVPGSLAGVGGYRRELPGQRRAVELGAASALGAVAGAVALLALPAAAFEAIVPAFIVVALVMVILQPRLAARAAARRASHAAVRRSRLLPAALFGIGVYGGYFGAAQGILLLALLSVTLPESLQRVNALKNVLAGLTNLVAGIVFALVADVDWQVAAVLAVGSTLGGVVGANVGRRLPPTALRALIVVVGITAIVKLTLL